MSDRPANSRPGFMLYRDNVRPIINFLSREQLGDVFAAIFAYCDTGECLQLDETERFAFETIRPNLDKDAESYDEKCLNNRYSRYCRTERAAGREPVARELWLRTLTNVTNVNERQRASTFVTNNNDSTNGNSSTNDSTNGNSSTNDSSTSTPEQIQSENERERVSQGETTPRYIPGVGYETEGRPSSKEEIEAMTAQRKRELRKMLGG